MVDAVRQLTREQLKQFLRDHQAIRTFERMQQTALVDTPAMMADFTAALNDAAVLASTVDARLSEAVAASNRLSEAIEALLTEPAGQVVQSADDLQPPPAIQGCCGEDAGFPRVERLELDDLAPPPQQALSSFLPTISSVPPSGSGLYLQATGSPALTGLTTVQLQVNGTTQQYFTSTQIGWGLGATIPSLSTTRYVFGVSGNSGIEIAALGGAPRWVSKRYNGTYAAPTKIVNGNTIALFRTEGYQETTPAFVATASFDVVATEDWTSTANGHRITFRSVSNGTATGSTTLILQGPQSQFTAGTVAAPSLTFQTDLTSGIYLPSVGTVGLSGGGVLSAQLSSTTFAALLQLILSGDISPAQLTANTDDWNPTGLSTASVIRVSTDASRNLTGIQGGADGRVLILINVGAQPVVLVHDSTSTAANRFFLASSTNTTVQANGACVLWYDSTSSRWRQITRVA